jgi:hypothetical protein
MPWRKHALELAEQIRAEDSSAHSLNLAVEIASRWRHDSQHCPGTGKLLRVIRDWEEKGKLTPSTRSPEKRSLGRKAHSRKRRTD